MRLDTFILILLVVLFITCTDTSNVNETDYSRYEDNDYGSSGDGHVMKPNFNDTLALGNHNFTSNDVCEGHVNVKREINLRRDSVTSLFSSQEEVQEKVFVKLENVGMSDYWMFEEIEEVLREKLNEYKKSNFKRSVEKDINDLLDGIEKEKKRYKCEHKDEQKLFDTLEAEKSTFDCALNRSRRNDHYSAISDYTNFGSIKCGSSIVDLWWDLVNQAKSKEKCSFDDAMESLIKIVHHADSPMEQRKIKVHHDYSLALLTPDHYHYLQPFLCDDKLSAKDCTTYKNALCKNPSYHEVTRVSNLCEEGSKSISPTSLNQLLILLDVNERLGKIASQLTTQSSVRNSETADIAKNLLESYLGIIDTAIGNSSIRTWQQTEAAEAQMKFQHILLSNEDYIGFASELILASSTRDTTVQKETLSLSMKRVKPSQGSLKISIKTFSVVPKSAIEAHDAGRTDSHQPHFSNEDNTPVVSAVREKKVAFSFDGAEIWTQNLSDHGISNTDSKVYAVYYKSWYEILTQIRGHLGLQSEHSDGLSSSFGHTNLTYFVGKGGVISLSTRTNQTKESVPVSYKMYFDGDYSIFNENGTKIKRCFSCGYLDEVTGTWQTLGCVAKEVDDVGVTCNCNHTTNFAAFMTPSDIELSEIENTLINIFEYIGSVTSVIGLTLSIVAFCIVRNTARNDRLRAHMNLAIALLFVHLIQLVADIAVYDNVACIVVTIATHYFLLASFMWMFVEGIFLYFYVVQVFMLSKIENRQWMYLIGWGMPVLIVAISVGYGLPNDLYVQPQLNEQNFTCPEGQILYIPHENMDQQYETCWLSKTSGMIWSFLAPAICVITFNFVVLCKVVVVLVKLSERSKGMKSFQVSNHSSNSYGYQRKSRLSSQAHNLKPFSNDLRVSEQNNSTPTHDNDFPYHSETSLHGNVITHGGSISASRSNSHSNQYAVSRQSFATNAAANDDNFLSDVKTAVKGAVVLLPLLGITWIFGILGSISFAFLIIFALLNATQGLAIFFVYVIYNGEVCRALRRRLELNNADKYNKGRGRTSSTSSLKSMFNKGLLRNWRRRSTAISTLSTSTQQA